MINVNDSSILPLYIFSKHINSNIVKTVIYYENITLEIFTLEVIIHDLWDFFSNYQQQYNNK